MIESYVENNNLASNKELSLACKLERDSQSSERWASVESLRDKWFPLP